MWWPRWEVTRMTFCKLVAGNVRRHLRDYGVYFLTLTLAVALFYAFNAVGEQQAFLVSR